jgi:hypothetical protein
MALRKKSIVLLASSFALAIILVATGASAMQSLTSETWKSRVLLIFGEAGDPDVKRQRDLLLDDRDGLEDRDMLVLQVAGPTVEVLHGKAQRLAADALRRDLNIDQPGFHIVLVGKDGTVKLAERQPVSRTALYGLIDGMPMRRSEQR